MSDTNLEHTPMFSSSNRNGHATHALVGHRTTKPKKVDPNAPKRASTVFILFSQDERANVKQDNPHACNTEICALLGLKWHAADPDVKAKYAALYKDNKTKADAERLVYGLSVKSDSNADRSIIKREVSDAKRTFRRLDSTLRDASAKVKSKYTENKALKAADRPVSTHSAHLDAKVVQASITHIDPETQTLEEFLDSCMQCDQ